MLELCTAPLLVRALCSGTVEQAQHSIVQYLFADITTTLVRVRTLPYKLVNNKVKNTTPNSRHHVPKYLEPTDISSRGMLASE